MSKQEIERCIAACEKNGLHLRQMAQKSDDNHLKRTLLDSVRHIDLCVQECRSGVEQVKTERAF